MKCPRHSQCEAGECWWCAGKPPNWRCRTCGRGLPCDHIHVAPSLTRASAMTRSDLMTAIELYRAGTCDWRYVETRLDIHESEVRTAWAHRKAGGN